MIPTIIIDQISSIVNRARALSPIVFHWWRLQVCKEWQRTCRGDAACKHQLAEAAAAAAGARSSTDGGKSAEDYAIFKLKHYFDVDHHLPLLKSCLDKDYDSFYRADCEWLVLGAEPPLASRNYFYKCTKPIFSAYHIAARGHYVLPIISRVWQNKIFKPPNTYHTLRL